MGTFLTIDPLNPPDQFNWIGLLASLALGLVVMAFANIISAIFMKRSLDRIAQRLGVGMFMTAALIHLIGAVLAIIVAGFVLVWIAEILFVVAFFSLPDQVPQPAAAATPPQPIPPPPPAA